MDFKELYAKYQAGTASKEEIQLVEDEINKSKEVLDILNTHPIDPINETDNATVKKAKKQFTIKSIVRTAAVSLLIVVVVAGVICGSVFGAIKSYATKSTNISADEAKNIAIQYVVDNYSFSGKIVVTDFEKDLEIKSDIKKSYYNYEIEVSNGVTEIELCVNAKTGIVSIDN